jgi:hypothetical protein
MSEPAKCGSFAKPKFRDGETRNEIHIPKEYQGPEREREREMVHVSRAPSTSGGHCVQDWITRFFWDTVSN